MSVRKGRYLVELLRVLKALEDAAVLPLPVLSAGESGALLVRSAGMELFLQRELGGPETVGLLVPHFQEELNG